MCGAWTYKTCTLRWQTFIDSAANVLEERAGWTSREVRTGTRRGCATFIHRIISRTRWTSHSRRATFIPLTSITTQIVMSRACQVGRSRNIA